MPRALRGLPAGYERTGALDLSERGVAIGLLVLSLVLLLPTCGLILVFMGWARPEAGWPGSLIAWAGSTEFAFVVIIATVGVVLVHEAIHGACFWVVTHDRPRFGLSGLSAYAAAPDWYIPLMSYLVIGLAPVIVITGAALALMLIVPPPMTGVAGVVLVLNGVGSIGDVFAVGRLLRHRPGNPLVCDRGTRISVYQSAREPTWG